MPKPWGVSKVLERALQREVVFNKVTGEYGVVMEDGKIEITSYTAKPDDIWPTRSYLGSRIERTEEWSTFASS